MAENTQNHPRSRNGRYKARIVCAKGHPLTDENVYVEPKSGKRKCRTCKKERGRGYQSGTYGSWRAMRRRCYDPTSRAFPWYGGRGIVVCARWDLFANFLADMGERPEGCSLDRIDSDRDYGPENCQWATIGDQLANRRMPGSGVKFNHALRKGVSLDANYPSVAGSSETITVTP